MTHCTQQKSDENSLAAFAREFALVADAIQKEFAPRGFDVYVSSNTQSISVTERGKAKVGAEADVHIKLRRLPRG